MSMQDVIEFFEVIESPTVVWIAAVIGFLFIAGLTSVALTMV